MDPRHCAGGGSARGGGVPPPWEGGGWERGEARRGVAELRMAIGREALQQPLPRLLEGGAPLEQSLDLSFQVSGMGRQEELDVQKVLRAPREELQEHEIGARNDR